MLGVSLSLTSARRAARSGTTPPPSGTTTDPNVTQIQADGWRAAYSGPPAAFDPVGDPRAVVVQRPGFDGAGQGVTVEDVLTVMSRVRQPYPNQASLTAEDVALSDVVYQGDTITGVTNGSTRAYPKPVAMWLDHDLRRVTGGSYTARLAVAHAHARGGRPVAAVRFSASDGVTTLETTVSAMSVTTYPRTGLSVPHFAAPLDFSTLAANAMITIDAVIYPWVGPAFTLSTDAAPYPSPSLTVLKVLNDVSYGTAYAYVDASAGSDGTGVVSTTASTAAATPFATVPAAASAIQTFNSANFARNSVSGGVIRLVEGTHTHGSFSARAVTDIPLEIEAVGARAATIYRDAGAHTINSLADMVLFRGVTFRRTTASNIIFLDTNAPAGGAHMLVLDGCDFDLNGFARSAAYIQRLGRVWMIGCGGDDAALAQTLGATFTAVNAIGSLEGAVDGNTFNAAGCRDLEGLFKYDASAAPRPPRVGAFCGFNHLGSGTGVTIVVVGAAIDAAGLALVGNVIEGWSGFVGPVIDGTLAASPLENVVSMLNTVVGQRTNWFYLDVATGNNVKTGRDRFSVHHSFNMKGDVFGADGTLVGNWSNLYKAGYRAGAYLIGSQGGDTPGVGSWVGEIAALGEVSGTDAAPIATNWTADASQVGSGLGNGDYTPGTGHALPSIPAGLAPWSHDQKGRALADDGSAVIGAVQPH